MDLFVPSSGPVDGRFFVWGGGGGGGSSEPREPPLAMALLSVTESNQKFRG